MQSVPGAETAMLQLRGSVVPKYSNRRIWSETRKRRVMDKKGSERKSHMSTSHAYDYIKDIAYHQSCAIMPIGDLRILLYVTSTRDRS